MANHDKSIDTRKILTGNKQNRQDLESVPSRGTRVKTQSSTSTIYFALVVGCISNGALQLCFML